MCASKLIAIKNSHFLFVCVCTFNKGGVDARQDIYKENSGFVLFLNEAHNDNVVHECESRERKAGIFK